ncbi:hypothetical protein IVB12_28530 [Bradyrhizobium sp. 179]|uniref:hypothetical protein n=1 Tax=Bradyrhizobium sp. 179 TaxID=2782648 RepID=UPI001FF7922C|nr:hypothetical protein [Bradyrhizobium sp. 179]MCK1545779.1 hypothetical protein [Bradyrhizobium sp. 179]
MVGEAMIGITALKSAFDLTKGLKDVDDRVRLNDARMELQQKILDAQEAQSALLEKLGNLEKELALLKSWEADKQRYALTDMGSGVLAYKVKEGHENGEPSHSLCSSCYNDSHKSILVSATWNPGRCHVLVCNDCGWYGYISGMAHAEHKDLRPKPFRGR